MLIYKSDSLREHSPKLGKHIVLLKLFDPKMNTPIQGN